VGHAAAARRDGEAVGPRNLQHGDDFLRGPGLYDGVGQWRVVPEIHISRKQLPTGAVGEHALRADNVC
jgi:hypothetical protein